jgi:outer membrane protein assembly factor BamE (lipoprotein component of BamABCDE complex)
MSNQDYSYMRKGAFFMAKNPFTEKKHRRPLMRSLAAICIALSVSACAADVAKHGHIFTDEDLAQVKEGMTRDQIILALGTPDTKSTVGQEAFYYISTTTKRSAAFMSPTIVDRRVVAVYFDKKEKVTRIAHYGLQDGKVVDLSSNVTPSKGSEDGLLKEIFRNIGRPPSAGAGQEN